MFRILIVMVLFQFQYALAEEDYGLMSDSLMHADSAGSYSLSITSNLVNARIYLDTEFIGITPLINYTVKKGAYNLKIYNSKPLKDWETENKSLSVYVNSDTTFDINFRYFYYFNSTPDNTQILKNDTLLGSTPLRFFKDYKLTGSLLFRKINYKDYIYEIKNYDFETGADIVLQSKGIESVNDLVYKDRVTQFKTKRSLITIGALGLGSLAGGFFAVNYKNKANDEYDNYLNSGNPASLDMSKSNDKYFVISLVLMQAAIGGLIYFLFFDK
ncbi:MAG: PEGA domain-containing protein [bacterium]